MQKFWPFRTFALVNARYMFARFLYRIFGALKQPSYVNKESYIYELEWVSNINDKRNIRCDMQNVLKYFKF